MFRAGFFFKSRRIQVRGRGRQKGDKRNFFGRVLPEILSTVNTGHLVECCNFLALKIKTFYKLKEKVTREFFKF